MPHRRIGVVVAMRRELGPMLSGVRGQRTNGVEFFELKNAVVAVGGIGLIAARRAAEAVVKEYGPNTLISAGMAGALTAKLKVGNVVEGREVVHAESGIRFNVAGGESVIVTVSSVSGPAEKRALAERYGADVVDMEAAGVAMVAQESGIEFRAIKAISDELDFTMPPLAGFVEGNGRFAMARFVRYIALRPRWWSAVRRLGANSKTASVNLSHALKHQTIDSLNESLEENISRI